MKSIGIVAFSFALREKDEPNPCNKRLGLEVLRLAKTEVQKGNEVVVVAQWEIALALDRLHFPYALSVDRTADKYLDSEDVMQAAKTLFTERSITDVIPVAQPFLQIIKCKKLVIDSGFTLINRTINKIGFDKDSDQPWTRSAFALLVYAIKQKLFGSKGK